MSGQSHQPTHKRTRKPMTMFKLCGFGGVIGNAWLLLRQRRSRSHKTKRHAATIGIHIYIIITQQRAILALKSGHIGKLEVNIISMCALHTCAYISIYRMGLFYINCLTFKLSVKVVNLLFVVYLKLFFLLVLLLGLFLCVCRCCRWISIDRLLPPLRCSNLASQSARCHIMPFS